MNKRVIIIIAVILVLVPALLLAGYVLALKLAFSSAREYMDDIYATVPGLDGMILIKEWCFLLGSGEEIYLVDANGKNPVLLGTCTGGDDGACPFTSGAYSLSYDDGILTVSWHFSGDVWRTETFEVPQE